MKPPIFILGTQRAGTTLLTRVLSAHPKIYIKNELQVQEIFKPSHGKEDVLAAIKAQIEASAGRSIETMMEREGLEDWGLKDPELTNYIAHLEEFIPESKFIIIVRDGRGVVNSYKHNKWGLGTNAYTGTLRWVREVEEQLAFQAKYPENTLLIRYEDLVTDMENAIKKVCAHIGQEFDPALLDYHQSKSQIKKNRENIHTNKKPDEQLSKKWKDELSPFEIDVVESVARELLVKMDYTLVGKPVVLSALQIAYFNLHQRIVGEVQLQYRWRKSRVKAYMNARRK